MPTENQAPDNPERSATPAVGWPGNPVGQGSGTPWSWRAAIGVGLVVVLAIAYGFREALGVRGQAVAGICFFLGLVALFSTNLRAVNYRTLVLGFALQCTLAILVLKVEPVSQAIQSAAGVVKQFIGFSDEGAQFVFGNLSDARPADKGGTWSRLFPVGFLFPFAFVALPPILFIAAFFSLLYHWGVLQRCVRFMARIMVYFLGTSGAETLSVSANVFMGQTEAPIIVKPYIPRMTMSELFTLMVSGMAHISGGMMVVYINYGADPVAVLTTCVMACPCSLYLAKLYLPEVSTPETAGTVNAPLERSPFVNSVDAIASGTTDGLKLAANIAAMLIVFTAFVAMVNAMLGGIKPTLIGIGLPPDWFLSWPDALTLREVFGWIFSPAAYLMGVEAGETHKVGGLLGAKLAINEHYAYLQMKEALVDPNYLSARSQQLAAFALTGFANFASVGIQLGGIGSLAPGRRQDLARLGGRALFVGFTATLLNAAIAGVLL